MSQHSPQHHHKEVQTARNSMKQVQHNMEGLLNNNPDDSLLQRTVFALQHEFDDILARIDTLMIGLGNLDRYVAEDMNQSNGGGQMTPEERIALVRELSATVPVLDGCEPMSADEAVRVYLNDKGEWRTWKDQNPDYADDGAAQCCEACSMPMNEGFMADDSGPWCSPACMWGDDDREVIAWDFALLGDALYWTEWEELDDDEEPYFLPKGEA